MITDETQLCLTLEPADVRVRKRSQFVSSPMPHLQCFDVMPDGWMADKSWGSPRGRWTPIHNGKSVLKGGRKGVLKFVESTTTNQSLTLGCCATITAKSAPERLELTIEEKAEASKAMNQLAREQLKLKIMKDVAADLMICKIEGWDIKGYISDLKTLIDETAYSITRKAQVRPEQKS